MQDSCQSASRLRYTQVIKIEAVQSGNSRAQRSVRVIIWTCVSQRSLRGCQKMIALRSAYNWESPGRPFLSRGKK